MSLENIFMGKTLKDLAVNSIIVRLFGTMPLGLEHPYLLPFLLL